MDLFTPRLGTIQALRSGTQDLSSRTMQALADQLTGGTPAPTAGTGDVFPIPAGPNPRTAPLADVLGAPSDLVAALLRYGGVMNQSTVPALGSTDLRRVLGADPPPTQPVTGAYGIGQKLFDW